MTKQTIEQLREQLHTIPVPEERMQMLNTPFTALYRNWRGETAIRNILPKSVRFGSTAWHKEPQWLLIGTDIDKGEEREFALRDFSPVHVDDMLTLANEAGQAVMREKAAEYIEKTDIAGIYNKVIADSIRGLSTQLNIEEKKTVNG